MRIPPPLGLNTTAEGLTEQLAALQRVSGVYVLYAAGFPLHLSWSTNLARRLKRLLAPAGSLAGKIDSVQCWPTGSRLELNLLLYRLAKQIHPETYLRFLKLRIPWFVGLTGADPYPRLETINRFHPKFTALWGPFPARGAAQQYEDEVLSLFQIRRCTETLAPHPDHPGCIYGEMNQCLRPCQGAVTAAEYRGEAGRVGDFLASNGRAAMALLTSARDRACDQDEFEQAAQMHKRLEKMKATAALRDPVVADAKAFHGIALTRSTGAGRLLLWPMIAGLWQPPVSLELLEDRSRPKSLDTQIRELLAGALSSIDSDGDRTEEIAVFSRWYHSSWRDGEWFPFESLAALNYRKLVRAVSKLAHADQPSAVSNS